MHFKAVVLKSCLLCISKLACLFYRFYGLKVFLTPYHLFTRLTSTFLWFIQSHQPLTCWPWLSAAGLFLFPARWAGFQVSFSPLEWDWMVSRILNHLQSQISWKEVKERFKFWIFSQECSPEYNFFWRNCGAYLSLHHYARVLWMVAKVFCVVFHHCYAVFRVFWVIIYWLKSKESIIFWSLNMAIKSKGFFCPV